MQVRRKPFLDRMRRDHPGCMKTSDALKRTSRHPLTGHDHLYPVLVTNPALLRRAFDPRVFRLRCIVSELPTMKHNWVATVDTRHRPNAPVRFKHLLLDLALTFQARIGRVNLYRVGILGPSHFENVERIAFISLIRGNGVYLIGKNQIAFRPSHFAW